MAKLANADEMLYLYAFVQPIFGSLPQYVFTTALRPHNFFPPFLLAASEFLNGKPLVRLSAPVFREMRPLLLPKSITHRPTDAKKVLKVVPSAKDVMPVCVHMA